MDKLYRRITRPRWQMNTSSKELPDSYLKVRAEAFVNCMQPEKDSLSFWQSTNLEEEFGCLIALFCTMDSPSRIDIVTIDKNLVLDKIHHVTNPGESKAKSFNSLHIDLIDLNYENIGLLVDKILTSLSLPKTSDIGYKRYSEAEVKSMVASQIIKKKISLDELSDRWAEKLMSEFSGAIKNGDICLNDLTSKWHEQVAKGISKEIRKDTLTFADISVEWQERVNRV